MIGALTTFSPTWQYGRITDNKKVRLAHRVFWELQHGYLDSQLDVLHKCDNTKCVNPEHLFIGGQTENNLDRDRKLRMFHKISPEDVHHIRDSYVAGTAAQKDLAMQYGLNQSQISRIVNYRRWQLERVG